MSKLASLSSFPVKSWSRVFSTRAELKQAAKSSFLTADNYPVQRSPAYKTLDETDISYFKSILDPPSIIQNPDTLNSFNRDWMLKYCGQSKLVVQPTTPEQVSKILSYCNEKKLAVSPQGGNTSLVGGSVPVFDEIILSLSKLNKIRKFDEVTGILQCDAGIILQDADEYLQKQGYIFPVDLGAKGSCQIGGMVSTNAGGLRLLRYGSLHGSVLGLEVVLPNGRIIDAMHSLRKDNTGYDWKQLYIGSEGTLGIITGVSILSATRSKNINVTFVGVPDFFSVKKLFVKAKNDLGEILSAFEFMDGPSQKLTKVYRGNDCAYPLEGEYPYYVLIETSGSNIAHDQEKIEKFLEESMENGLVEDGTLGQDEASRTDLWHWRELIPEACQMNGGVYKYDISLPLDAFPIMIKETNDRLKEKDLVDGPDKPAIAAYGFGHIGDGNLHLNIAVNRYDKSVEKALEPFIYELVAALHGSVSAEHGLGFQKSHCAHYTKSQDEINIMRALRNTFDPNHIINPYKFIESK